jgi:hypothetical protein
MNSTCWIKTLTAGAVLVATGLAVAQTPVVDGRRNNPNLSNPYGSPIALQTASVIGFEVAPRVNLCFQSNQSNVGGKSGYNVTGTQSAPNVSDPAGVITGVEMSIRLADIGMTTIPPSFKITGFVNGSGHDFLSNQVFRGSTNDPENLGEPRTTDFNLELPGEQFITVNTATRSGTAPTIDGVRNEAPYVVFPQIAVGTQFGSSNRNPALRNRANGSEIDGVSAYIYNNGTPANPADDVLVLHVAGNIETNFNKLDLFFDYNPLAGQNVLRNDNPDVDFNGLNRMGTNTVENPAAVAPAALGPGLTFDSGFTADYYLMATFGGGTEPASPNVFVNSAVLRTGGANPNDGLFGGSGPILPTAGTPVAVDLAPLGPLDGLVIDLDNSNSDAVPGSGGVGGRANLPGSGTQADVSPPAGVTTGFEFKVNLDGIGYVPGVTEIKVAGIIVGPSYDFMSNQAIGGLTATGALDPNNLGFPARDVDFNAWNGNQFVSVAVPGSIPAAPAGSNINGSIDAAETSFYGSPLWVNTTNGTGFGDSIASGTNVPGPNRSFGSEMNSVYFRVANDPTDGNRPKLYGIVTGNLHDFNKLVLFFDTNPAEGQNDIRGDNAGFENFNGGLGGVDGFQFDTGFTADYAIAYNIGFDSGTGFARHFVDGTQLLTNGGGYGGRFGGGNKTNTTAVCGTIFAREGFGSNDLVPLAQPNRSPNANGSELNALYARAVSNGQGAGTLYLFLAGNLEPGLNSVELFFDNKAGGQNSLIFSDRDPADPLYTGNPGTDFSALNRMGGPFQPPAANEGDPLPPQQPGLTFDADFLADYWFSYRLSPYDVDTQKVQIFGNYARLRSLDDPAGPLPDNYDRYFGVVENDAGDSFGSGFLNGDGPEVVSQAAIDNANILGVPQGRFSYCDSSADGPPQNVITGLEVAIDLADLGYGPGNPYVVGTTQIKFLAFVNDDGHDFVSNQFLPPLCSNDLGEPRLVNLASIAGNQYVTWPTATPINTERCSAPSSLGDANNDGFVNFTDITTVLANFGSSGSSPLNGDADNNGTVNFTDITTVLANFGSTAGPSCN